MSSSCVGVVRLSLKIHDCKAEEAAPEAWRDRWPDEGDKEEARRMLERAWSDSLVASTQHHACVLNVFLRRLLESVSDWSDGGTCRLRHGGLSSHFAVWFRCRMPWLQTRTFTSG